MDTSETYARMSREAWEDDESYVPQVGDYAIRYIETSNRVGLVSMNRDQGQEHLYWHTLDEEDGLTLREPQTSLSRLIPLCRQDQLQEMVIGNAHTYGWSLEQTVEQFYIYVAGHVGEFTSMEQLWLSFVKKEKHGQVWDGEDWSKQ
ncbi:hypothetical protein LCGC14_1499780 [marine sediment metagenome]|uniref:Uncharacterized protein n=1 Tax=marine sediment metagenome TaxID=412755 RepID=A0A0F9J4Y6_9ZZZZ